jgi:hypothetical protein
MQVVEVVMDSGGPILDRWRSPAGPGGGTAGAGCK